MLKSLNRLVNKQLVETNTKIFESINGSTHIRLTSAGWYYLKYLINSFSYLDLVFQDTPINDRQTVNILVQSMNKVNNLSDPEEDKLLRLEERFRRVGVFLQYLKQEEELEVKKYFLKNNNSPIYIQFMPAILKEFTSQSKWILHRVTENKEKYSEEYEIKVEDDVFTIDSDLIDVD